MTASITWVVSGAAAVALLVGFSSPMKPPAENSLAKEIARYRKWHKLTPHRVHMAPQVAALCANVTATSIAGGPHGQKYFNVYVNSIGDAAMADSTKDFPAGSVIVKEKFGSMSGGKPELLTVMVKRPYGYDTSNGDWEYFTANGSGDETSTEGKAKCQTCHRANSKTDYVFRTYADAPPHR